MASYGHIRHNRTNATRRLLALSIGALGWLAQAHAGPPTKPQNQQGAWQLYTTNATVTAYCSCSVCCGSWATVGKTAMGTVPKADHTVAGPRALALGTRVSLQGIFPQPVIRVVEDRLARRFDDRFDIYFQNHQQAKQFGIKKGITVYVTKSK